jgi:phospholipid/cholesterol/gamma-HCH transport system substrate-binding protein
MNQQNQKFKIRLGLFITGGLAIFVIAIFVIGKQKNLFDPVFKLTTTFYNVSGLQVGSNIRFSGINVGTVDNISIINDSTVRVDMLIKRSVQQFIKTDCEAGIGSAGIIGDKILIITQGSSEAPMAKDGQQIESKEPIETDAIMASLKVTADNAAIISSQLAEITDKVNTGNGTLWKLIRDSTMASNISQTIVSLKKSSKGLDENMDAAKHNFLLRGFFKDKEKAAQKVKTDSLDKIAKEQKATQKAKDDSDKKKAAEQKVIEKKEKSDQKEKLKEEKKAEEQKPIDKGVK